MQAFKNTAKYVYEKCTGFTSEEWQINPVLKIEFHGTLKYFEDFLISLPVF